MSTRQARQAAMAVKQQVRKCAAVACDTLIATGTHCRKHQIPPAEGAWIIAQQVREELRGDGGKR